MVGLQTGASSHPLICFHSQAPCPTGAFCPAAVLLKITTPAAERIFSRILKLLLLLLTSALVVLLLLCLLPHTVSYPLMSTSQKIPLEWRVLYLSLFPSITHVHSYTHTGFGHTPLQTNSCKDLNS